MGTFLGKAPYAGLPNSLRSTGDQAHPPFQAK